MDELEHNSLLKQLEMAQRNLNHLKEQAEGFGQFTPPYVKIGIEDGEKKVAELRHKLGLSVEDESTAQPTNPPAQSDPAQTVSIQTPTSSEKPARTKVFISYSHVDKEWLARLQVHLKPYEQFGWTNKDGSKGKLEWWDDTMIPIGSKWFDEIKKGLDATRIGVCLVTPDFLASKFITTHELTSFLALSKEEGLIIFPVIVASSAFSNTWLGEYQTFNPPSEPLAQLNKAKREQALAKLAETIVRVIKS